jgi:hypothetical protein
MPSTVWVSSVTGRAAEKEVAPLPEIGADHRFDRVVSVL